MSDNNLSRLVLPGSIPTYAWVAEGRGSRASGPSTTDSLATLRDDEEMHLPVFPTVASEKTIRGFSAATAALHRPDYLVDEDFTAADIEEAVVPIAIQPLKARHIERDQQYLLFRDAFRKALSSYLSDMGSAAADTKRAAFLSDRVIDEKDAAIVLSRFKTELIKLDPYRITENNGSRIKAKNLNKREQLLFKLVLERELGLDFVDSAKARANAEAFKFTVPASRLGRVSSGERLASTAV